MSTYKDQLSLNFIKQSTIGSFQVHDIVTDQLSDSYDLVLSRHTMQHLKNKDVQDILKNFIFSGSKYMLATNYPYLEVHLSLNGNIIYSFYFRRTLSLMKGPRQECEVSTSSGSLTSFLFPFVSTLIHFIQMLLCSGI